MWRLAYRLAESGEYCGWLHIEQELRSQGFSNAPDLLDNKGVRIHLDKLCRQTNNEHAGD